MAHGMAQACSTCTYMHMHIHAHDMHMYMCMHMSHVMYATTCMSSSSRHAATSGWTPSRSAYVVKQEATLLCEAGRGLSGAGASC